MKQSRAHVRSSRAGCAGHFCHSGESRNPDDIRLELDSGSRWRASGMTSNSIVGPAVPAFFGALAGPEPALQEPPWRCIRAFGQGLCLSSRLESRSLP